MSALQAEVYEAFRVLDVTDDKALGAAVALSAALTKVEDETARSFSKRDADVEAIRKDISGINKEIAGIDTRMAVMQGDPNGRMTSMQGEINLLEWMTGTVIAPLATVLFRVSTH